MTKRRAAAVLLFAVVSMSLPMFSVAEANIGETHPSPRSRYQLAIAPAAFTIISRAPKSSSEWRAGRRDIDRVHPRIWAVAASTASPALIVAVSGFGVVRGSRDALGITGRTATSRAPPEPALQ